MNRFYLAGPMRGYPQFNFPLFDEVAQFHRGLGREIISPADLDRGAGFDHRGHTGTFSFEELRTFVRRDMKALLSLRGEDGDGLLLLPGWQNSTGARAEHAAAKYLGLRISPAISVTIRNYPHSTPLPSLPLSCFAPRRERLADIVGYLTQPIYEDGYWQPERYDAVQRPVAVAIAEWLQMKAK